MDARLTAAVLCALSALALALPAASAAAGQAGSRGTELFVTVVARECPAYTDITANRARNNIQESLRDLGTDTLYAAGEPIDPAKERAGQPRCSPITGWRFRLGTGIRSRAVTGPWGSLSIVTDPFDTGITTRESVPLRDYEGRPTSESIEGAVTIQLSRAEAERAARASSLWIQGGTVTDPVLDEEFPGQFGFGALRCSVDNLNGDNVEWITFPQGSAHAFCYAYYVRPPPTSGTIVIRKEVAGTPGATQTFGFGGNLSYNPGGLFSLRVQDGRAASQTFYRAATGPGDESWVVNEDVPGGWALRGIDCRAAGGSAVSTDAASARTEIRLAAGDTVTCTYADEVRPPAGELFLNKLTRGGLGRFEFAVSPAGGGGEVGRAIAETAEEDVPAEARPGPLSLPPGRYAIEESSPDPDRGRWRLDGVTCDGLPLEDLARVEVAIEDRGGATCTFENSFVAPGEIEIDKVTLGGTDRAAFVIERRGGPAAEFRQTAVTRAAGVPARAEGSDTRNLELGTYVIGEQAPTAGVSQDWSLVQVLCNGEAVPSIAGRVVVTLTAERPTMRCTFTNVLVPEPVGPPPPDRHVPGRPDPELSITKRADRRVAIAGELVTYRVTVRNRGRATAEKLVINDLRPPGTRVVAARAGGRPCETGRVLHCRVKALRAGDSVRATLRLRVVRAGRLANAAVLHTSSPERVRRDNGDLARVRVLRSRCLPRAAAAGARARAAC